MTVRNLARISNDFEPSDRSIALDQLLSTREVAAMISLNLKTVTDRIRRHGLEAAWNNGGWCRYWTRQQADWIRRHP